MNRQKAFTLLELLLALAIAAVIITMSIRYFFITEENMRVEESIALIKNITRASFEWRAQEKQADFDLPTAISIQGLLDLGLIRPEEKLNPWGGDVTVQAAEDHSHIAISLSSIPHIPCLKIKRALDPKTTSELTGTCDEKKNIYTGVF